MKLFRYCWLLATLLVCTSCMNDEEFHNTPSGNFEALWQMIDEHYCFLDYKQIDWDAVHTKYAQQVSAKMTSENLFEVLGNMLAELQDGHVNLSASHDLSRYWNWYLDYPRNYDESIVEQYLGRDYRITGGAKYTIFTDNVGYVSYESFSSAIGESGLDQLLTYLAPCNGLIIDIRNNGGGLLTTADRIASRFTNEKVLTGYIMHKTGKGHSDFSDPEPCYIEPSDRVRWQKKVCLLVNRHCFSAANSFINSMSCFDNVTIVGDKSGGGSGIPFTSELPNGWGIRFSASPMLNARKEQVEFGIDPDVYVSLSDEDKAKGVDTIIEAARKIINN